MGEVETVICSFYLCVAARKLVCADQSLSYTGLLLGRETTTKKRQSVMATPSLSSPCSARVSCPQHGSHKEQRWGEACVEGQGERRLPRERMVPGSNPAGDSAVGFFVVRVRV